MKSLTVVFVGCCLLTSCGSSKSTPMAGTDAGSDSGADAAVDVLIGDTTIRTVEADDYEHLLYSGRIDFTDPKAPTFSAPGVLVAARFTGVSVSVMLTDAFKGSNYANVVVDGTQYKIQPEYNKDLYTVVSDLPYGEHTVEFSKRTEASQGQMTFKGFQFGGTLLPAPTRPDRRIEIIGDSISCGSGDEAANNSAECSDNYGLAYENANVSYGAVLARNLAADYHITAVSGIGTIRNYNCSDQNTMPVVYDRMFLEQASSPAWDTSKFQPDAIIVALGTNDFSPDGCNRPPLSVECDPTNYQLFISQLEEFVGTTLRGYYPNAHMFLISSPMLGDGWPSPVTIGDAGTDAAGTTCAYTSRTSHIAALGTVVSDLTAGGDTKVHLVNTVPKVVGNGCGTHPGTKEHANIGGTCASNVAGCQDYLFNPVKQIMGW
jgi:lysophospholipase L1-like esterase